MTELRDKIERWCREEAMEIVVARDDDGAFGCALPAVGEPPIDISVRSDERARDRLLLAHTFEFAIPGDLAGDAQGAERFAALAASIALSRSALVECRPSWGQGRASVEVVVTLFEGGLSKLSFLTGLSEVRKAGVLLGRELEAASLASGVLAEVQSIVAQSAGFVSPPAIEAEPVEMGEPLVEAIAPPAVQAPEPPIEAAPAVIDAPAEEMLNAFCPNCGSAVRSDARFCKSCGARLEVE